MVCNICQREIADGQTMLTVFVGAAGAPTEEGDFTGVAWHPECAPEHRDHFRDEVERFARRRAGAAK